MSALPLDPLPLGAGSDAKLSGGRHRRSRHLGLGVGGVGEIPDDETAMMPPAPASAGRRRHTARGGVDAGRRRKHSRRAGQDAAVAGRRRKHSRRAGESAAVSAGRRRRHTRKH